MKPKVYLIGAGLVLAPSSPLLAHRGWAQFTLSENELYYNPRIEEQNCPFPTLTTHFKDKKTYQTKQHIVAWALERKDGRQGFGFGGGHLYSIEQLRKEKTDGK